MSEALTIGKAAERAGVSVETIRFYQRRGLIEEPEKPPRGIRRYSSDDVRRVRFIKRAQGLGFTLAEAATLLRFEDARLCAETRDVAARKVAELDAKLRALTAMRGALTQLMRQCDEGGPDTPCPIIQALDPCETG